RTVWGVDTSADRKMTWVAGAVVDEDGIPFATVRVKRAGMLWLPDYLEELAKQSGYWEVAVMSKGCPAMEFVKALEDKGFTVHALDGPQFALATGRITDAVRDKRLKLVKQPDVDLGIQGGVTHKY